MLPSEALYEECGILGPSEERMREIARFLEGRLGSFSVVVNNTPSWPHKLADSERPTPLIYYRGDIGLVETQGVSVVGARKASEAGRLRARRIARELAEAGVTVVTGLAAGIDTAATESAIKAGGKVTGVIGTPIDEAYPKENRELQEKVARRHLLISQVPFFRYSQEAFKEHRYHFPERNELMAAVSDATVIVEASDTSGTLTQARACLHQGRPLLIMRSCTEAPGVTWPNRFVGKEGVHVIDNTEQVLEAIGAFDGRA